MRAIIFAFLFFASSSHASPLEDCLSKSTGSQGAWGCEAEESERQDKQLRQFVSQRLQWIMSNENEEANLEQRKEQHKQLNESQKQWLRYRDSWCHYQASTVLGTGAPGMFVQCKQKLTQQRAKELRNE